MNKRFMQVGVGFVIVFAAAQLIRPDRTNPATDASQAIGAQAGTAKGLAAVLDRSCGDCHSNRTVWPSYTRIAPVSWAMSYAVSKGRNTVNFSEWAGYNPDQQRVLLALSCDAVTQGKMPGAWTLIHPEAKLSAQDVAIICSAARQADAIAAR